MLKKLTLLRERVTDWQEYPFSVPVIRTLEELVFEHRVCLFTGENGTGKSNLLEAIAVHHGFGCEGGTRSFANDSTESNHSVDQLVNALRLSFDRRTGAGYYLRAESFFNAASYIDEIGFRPTASKRIEASRFRYVGLSALGFVGGAFRGALPQAGITPRLWRWVRRKMLWVFGECRGYSLCSWSQWQKQILHFVPDDKSYWSWYATGTVAKLSVMMGQRT